MIYYVVFYTIIAVFLACVNVRISWRIHRDPLNVLVLSWFFFILMYVGKFIYIYASDELAFSYNYRYSYTDYGLVAGSLLALFSIQFFSYAFIIFSKDNTRLNSVNPGHVKTNPERHFSFNGFTLVFSLIVSLCAYYSLFGMMSISDVFESLNNRFDVFSGRGYLAVLLGCYKISAFIWVFTVKNKPSILKIFLVFFPAIFFDLVSGSRGKVVFENILPLLCILSVRNFVSFNFKKLSVYFIIFFVFSLVFRSAVRDTAYSFNEGKTTVEIMADNLNNFYEEFYGGPEAPYMDTMVYLVDEDFEYGFGSTIFAAVTYIIPRSIFEDKPRGASSVITEKFFPDYYYPFYIEFSIPFMTELFYNFGYFGFFFMFFLGYFCAVLYKRSRSTFSVINLLYIFILIRSVLLFRNDFFNNYISILSFAVFLFSLVMVNNFFNRFKRS